MNVNPKSTSLEHCSDEPQTFAPPAGDRRLGRRNEPPPAPRVTVDCIDAENDVYDWERGVAGKSFAARFAKAAARAAGVLALCAVAISVAALDWTLARFRS